MSSKRTDKRILVENAVAIDAWMLRTHLNTAGISHPVSYDAFWSGGKLSLSQVNAQTESLMDDLPEGYAGQVHLFPRECPLHTKGPQWMFRCGGCGNVRRFLYVLRPGDELICRTCRGLVHRSSGRWNNVHRTGAEAGMRGRMSKRGGGFRRLMWKALIESGS